EFRRVLFRSRGSQAFPVSCAQLRGAVAGRRRWLRVGAAGRSLGLTVPRRRIGAAPATCGSVCPEAERGFLAGHVAGPRIGPGTPPVGPSAPSVAAEAFGNRADGGVLSRCGRLVIAAAGALDLGLQVIGKGDG